MSINVGTAEAYLNLNYNGFTQGIQTATQQLNTFMDNTQSSGDRIEALGGVLSSVGSTLSKTVTPGIMAISAASVNAAASFESSMSNVQALSGATGEELERLSETAKKFGATTQFSASECSDAFGYMALAGWNTEQMISGLPGVLDLAAASSMQLSEASDILTDYISAFSLTAGDATHVADLMAYAQANSNTSTQQLADAFKNCAANANAYGYSMEETTGLLAAFADQGLKSGEAGTALNAIMRDMVNSMKDGAIKIGDTNVAITDASGNFLSFADIVNGVQSATDGMSESQRATALSATFTADSMKGMNLALAAGSDKIAKFTNELYNCDGAANDMAKTMQDNLKGKITQLKSALEGAGIAIGEKLIPALTDIVKGITNTVSSFNKLDEGTQKSIIKFGLIAAAAGPVISVIGKLVTGIGALVNIFSAASGAVVAMSSVLTPLGVVVGTVAAGVLVWKKNQDLMNGTVLDSKENMGLFERALASLQGETVYTKKELQELGYTFDDITDVNKDLQDAIYESKRDLADFKMVLHDTTLDNTFTQEEANNLVSRVDGAFQSCLEAIEEKYGATQDAMSEMFSVDGVINENESKILTWYQTQQDQMTAKASQLQEEINQIIANRTANGGELTEQEINQIQNRYAKIKQIELDCLADNEYERIRAQQEFILESNDLDLEGLSELIKNRREKYDEQNKDVLTNYNTQIEYLKNHLGEMDYETRIAAEAQIEQLEKDIEEKSNIMEIWLTK